MPLGQRLIAPETDLHVGNVSRSADTLCGVKERVTGTQVFAGDVRLPGMLYATVSACPSFGGKLVSFDAAKVMSMPGVRHVVPVGDMAAGVMAVAVLADTWWHAKQARDALSVTWDRAPAKGLSTDAIRATFARGPWRCCAVARCGRNVCWNKSTSQR